MVARVPQTSLLVMLLLAGCRTSAPASNLRDEGQFLDNPPGVSAELTAKIKAAVVDAGGTAFYINDAHLALTNYHVVSPCLERHLDELPARSVPVRLEKPIDCESYEVVALPPDPFQRTLEVGFMGEALHANEFLDWKRTRTDPALLKRVLVGTLETDDWAVIRVKTGPSAAPSTFLALSQDGVHVGQKLVGAGYGDKILRHKNYSREALEAARTTYVEGLQDPQLASYQQGLRRAIEEFDKEIAYRAAQDALPKGSRDYPDPNDNSEEWKKKARFATGSVKDQGHFIQEWQNEFSLEYLRAVWFPMTRYESDKVNDERIPIWINAGAIDGIEGTLKSYRANVASFTLPSRDPELTAKMRWRLRNLEARAGTDLNHAYYHDEQALIKACLDQPEGQACSEGSQRIVKILDEQISLWTSEQPTDAQRAFFSAADSVRLAVSTELQQGAFNGWGFVSNVDLVRGHSGSPLVDIASGKVVGIHFASNWGTVGYYSERRAEVDIRRVRRQLEELGIPFGK